MSASKNPLVRLGHMADVVEISSDGAKAFTLVIFDYDGTLADSAPWFASVINDVARKYRFKQVEPGELEASRGEDTGALLRRLGVARWKLPFIARHMRKLATRDRAKIKLFPGVGAMLESLHAAGFRLAIVSSNSRENVEDRLGREVAGLIEHYACGVSVFGKPKRFRAVLEATGVAPAAAIAIGDELRDLAAAREVGIAAGAVAWGYADAAALDAQHPTLMFANVDDIEAQLGTPRGR